MVRSLGINQTKITQKINMSLYYMYTTIYSTSIHVLSRYVRTYE